MSNRHDVETGRLVYTCNCGWLDKGHGDPTSYRPHVGAQNLWEQLLKERPPFRQNKMSGFLVTYRQDMGLTFRHRVVARAGEERSYFVKAGLSLSEKETVALAIFMEVSYAFEDLQGSFPFSVKSGDSSFSQEDLVSDLIGFYQAVRPGMNYVQRCQPVSVEASMKIWDTYGPVGQHKNKTFQPTFYPCTECQSKPLFPQVLQAIQPAEKGTIFFDLEIPRERMPRHHI